MQTGEIWFCHGLKTGIFFKFLSWFQVSKILILFLLMVTNGSIWKVIKLENELSARLGHDFYEQVKVGDYKRVVLG